jgi:hypothetical protein
MCKICSHFYEKEEEEEEKEKEEEEEEEKEEQEEEEERRKRLGMHLDWIYTKFSEEGVSGPPRKGTEQPGQGVGQRSFPV